MLWIFAVLSVGLTSPQAWASAPQGLYLMTRIQGSYLEIKVWYFDGDRFAQEPRSATLPFKFDEAEKQSPGTTGRLSRTQGQWTLQWANGRKSTARHEAGKDGCFYWNAGLFCPVKPFATKQRLDGSYTGSLGTASVGSARTYTFTPDGRYQMKTSAAVRSNGPTVSMSGGASSQQEGRYRVQGQAMVLTPDGGTEVSMTAFPFESGADPTKPGRIYIGGFMLKRMAP
jgi:hypothetical protein